MSTIKIFDKEVKIPRQKWVRIVLGISLIFGGILGFLPVVGFWMLPLGFVVLSVDIALVRRFRRRFALAWFRWRRSKSR